MNGGPRFRLVGDSALLVSFGDQIDPLINQQVHALVCAIEVNQLPGIGETVPGYATLLVHYDSLLLEAAQVESWLRQQVSASQSEVVSAARLIEIPVRYGGEYGPDLAFVAEYHHIPPSEVIRLHSSAVYTVYMMGFTPGFPYLGGLDPALTTPRLDTPRNHIPGGSVGIAGAQTGVYPIDSPGGWRIIGWTPLPLFDLQRQPPFLLAPGDEIRFVPQDSSSGA